MATFTLTPPRPIPNQDVKLVVNADETDTNYFRIWATIAPTGSSLDNDIKNVNDPRSRVELYSNNGGTDFPLIYKFDKGGKYTFIVQEYIKGSGYGGAYEGDPNGSNLEVKNGNEYTVVVYIGQKLTQSIGLAENKATLNVWVWNNTIRPTYKSIHGEDTPSISNDNSSSRVQSAIESQSVKGSLLALANTPVPTAIGVLKDIMNDFWNTYNDHLTDATIHGGLSDGYNKLDTSLENCYTSDAIISFVNAAIPKFIAHLTNNNMFDPTATGVVGAGSGTWHQINDRVNSPLFGTVSSLDEAFGAVVDLFRCYELHRVSTNVHYIHDDTTNVLNATTPLMNVHKSFIEIIASDNPPAPAAQSSGAQLLISNVGFKEV